jgi:hypothetical protein
MSRVPYTIEQLKKLGLVEKNGVYVPVKSLVVKKVDKIIIDLNPTMVKDFKSIAISEPKGKMKAAIKTEIDGITFASRLEGYMYTLLRGSGLKFEMQKEYVLQIGFKYNSDTVRPIKIIVDFQIPSKNILIDTKGFQFRDGTIKYKMLKWYFYKLNHYPTIEMPKDKKECDTLLNRLLYDN